MNVLLSTQPIFQMEEWLIVKRIFITYWFFLPSTQPILLMEDWLIVKGIFVFCLSSSSSYCFFTFCFCIAFWLIHVKPSTQPILKMEDWLIVKGWFILLFDWFLIDYAEALDTTYPPNGGLADCPRLMSSIDSFVSDWLLRCLGHNLSSIWRTGWLSKADFFCLFILFVIGYSVALDTTYPPNGGLADCPRLIPSVCSFLFFDWLFWCLGHNLSSKWKTGWLSKADSSC